MPVLICEKHGRIAAPHMCRDAAELVWAGKRPGKLTYIDLDGFLFQGWVCDACLSRLNKKGLQAYLDGRKGQTDYPPEEQIDKFLDDLDWQSACPKCLETLTK